MLDKTHNGYGEKVEDALDKPALIAHFISLRKRTFMENPAL
ncbi:hypothetical protein [Kozakia baliensis]|nr:hypothetical protein [Kozakia baliensis]